MRFRAVKLKVLYFENQIGHDNCVSFGTTCDINGLRAILACVKKQTEMHAPLA